MTNERIGIINNNIHTTYLVLLVSFLRRRHDVVTTTRLDYYLHSAGVRRRLCAFHAKHPNMSPTPLGGAATHIWQVEGMLQLVLSLGT